MKHTPQSCATNQSSMHHVNDNGGDNAAAILETNLTRSVMNKTEHMPESVVVHELHNYAESGSTELTMLPVEQTREGRTTRYCG